MPSKDAVHFLTAILLPELFAVSGRVVADEPALDRNGTPGGDFVRSLSQGALLSVVDELLESGELSGRRGFSESFESSLARLVRLFRG